jgi:beta-lactamase regulating signal transducer with metallopeptidase domain
MIAYIFKSGIMLLLMYGAYTLLLKREKLFAFNRFFLMGSIIIALIIPLLAFPVTFTLTSKVNDVFTGYNNLISSPVTIDHTTSDSAISVNSISGENSITQNYKSILIVINLVISAFLLIRFIRNIYLIRRKISLNEKISHEGYEIVLTDVKSVPCCFYKTIFLNREDYNNTAIDPELVRHELEHARQLHTIDILFIELLKIFFWFNPLFILYDKAIRINHEYLADNGVIQNKFDISAYGYKLLAFASTGTNIPLTSSSNYSFTKNRIFMLTKSNPSRSSSGIRILMAISIMLLVSVTVSFQSPGGEVKGFVLNKYGKYLAGVEIQVHGQKSKVSTDEMGHFVLRNVPGNAEITISSKDYASKTVSPVFTSEMVVNLTPDISNDDLKKRVSEFFPARGSNPLIVIDGVPDEKLSMNEIDPSNGVSSIKILTSMDALQKYGDKTKSGAIEIITENGKVKTKSPAYDSHP